MLANLTLSYTENGDKDPNYNIYKAKTKVVKFPIEDKFLKYEG